MNRRDFLWKGAGYGAAAIGVGGYLYFQEEKRTREREFAQAQEREVALARRRAEFASRMVDDALPGLAGTSLRELNTLPVRAREEIQRYFHGKCLNVEGFVKHICEDEFVELIDSCHSQDERDACYVQAFCARVATDAEILNQVETIAAEVGSELDTGWASYCTELSGRWNTRIEGYGSPLTIDELTKQLDPMIRSEITGAARAAVSGNQGPSIGETIGKIGESAVRLLPLAKMSIEKGPTGIRVEGNPLVIPVFFLLAAREVWEFFAARIKNRGADYQLAISARLALLGNRVGGEFEREVRLRLANLHTWQERSIREAAKRLAEERVT